MRFLGKTGVSEGASITQGGESGFRTVSGTETSGVLVSPIGASWWRETVV